jgi:hypothetical protein
MEVPQSVLGEIAIRSGRHLASIDVGTLIRRLVLFERVIVKSFRLCDLPLLVRTFGKTGFEHLLNSGILKFCCEFTCIIIDINVGGRRSVPAEHFTLGTADAADRDGILHRELRGLQSISGLKQKERSAMEQAVWNSLIRPPKTFGADLLWQIEADLRVNSPSLKAGILDQLKKELPRFHWSGVQSGGLCEDGYRAPPESSRPVVRRVSRVLHQITRDMARSFCQQNETHAF